MLILVVRKIYRYFTFTAKVFRNFLRDYKSVHRLLRVLVNMMAYQTTSYFLYWETAVGYNWEKLEFEKKNLHSWFSWAGRGVTASIKSGSGRIGSRMTDRMTDRMMDRIADRITDRITDRIEKGRKKVKSSIK